jgi:CTP synthase
MTASLHLIVLGDYNPDHVAHQCIPDAVRLAAHAADVPVALQWLETAELGSVAAEQQLSEADGVWLAPGSPYRNMDGVLTTIRRIRENSLPFFGSCGGYQHALLEYARNVLGCREAGLAEVEPGCAVPLIGPLVCALIETQGGIVLKPGSRLAGLYGAERVEEGYHCSYGLNPQYLPLFAGSALTIAAWDEEGDPRAFELAGHPFFFGTAYQPERSARYGHAHPLITAFIRALAA